MRHMSVDEELYALLKSKADEWGCDAEQLLAAAAAYGLGEMIILRAGPRGLRDADLGRLEHYIARLAEQPDHHTAP